MVHNNYQTFAHAMNAGKLRGHKATVFGEQFQQFKRLLIQPMLHSVQPSPYLHYPPTILYNIEPILVMADWQIDSGGDICDQRHSPSPSIELDLNLSDLMRSPSPSVAKTDSTFFQLSLEACVKVQSSNIEGQTISSDKINNDNVICRQGITNTQYGNVTFR